MNGISDMAPLRNIQSVEGISGNTTMKQANKRNQQILQEG